jgi:hypothetical protein
MAQRASWKKFQSLVQIKRKFKYVMSKFKYIKSKGARDFLMDLGLVRDAIAIDVRMQNVLKKIGINIPEGIKSNPKLYDKVEEELLSKVCKPLNLSGVEFDKMIYNNYDEIMKMLVLFNVFNIHYIEINYQLIL